MDTDSQVAACDAVIGVANATIHGAGGLHIPTQCLLSLHSDWRWLSDAAVMRRYWYPSVGIARETKQRGWQPALEQVSNWLKRDAPCGWAGAYSMHFGIACFCEWRSDPE